MTVDNKKQPTLIDALIPVAILILMLFGAVKLYEDNSSYGPNQIALLLSAAVAMLIGYKNGFSWKELEEGIVKGISMALGAILILLMVGSLIGTWILAGTVPTMIYYGLQILDPAFFYAAACLICALVSISIGSSWTTAGTVGVALIGIASGLELSVAIAAGAVISGAYFGDKMSPLSDTTNLAPAVTGTELFIHIRHMAWTTGPSILIAIFLFLIIGLTENSSATTAGLDTTLSVIDNHFNISILSLIPLVVVLVLAYKRMPAFPTLMIGALLGGIFAIAFQPASTEKSVEDSIYSCQASTKQSIKSCEVLSVDREKTQNGQNQYVVTFDVRPEFSFAFTLSKTLDSDKSQTISLSKNGQEVIIELERRSYWVNAIDAVWRVMSGGYKSATGDASVDELLSRGGMESMLNPTVWLILCAMTFGAVLETVGLLQCLVNSALHLVKGTGSLVITVIATCIGINIIAADQYIAIVLPGRMYRAEFKRRKLHPKNLSRVLEDSATITSPLIPWNTCGAFMASTLGVSTFIYLPFCFFNLINPIVSIIYGVTNFKIEKIKE
ncbi:Na+/H+ antiporter NhaC family protein [Aliikangiella maris]|uniref:Na+/H+ antiporter NhaC family protein n=2 Tax=Aliikangiella maris TaxID=3162458 RepID=A0ABV3MJI2_9GAMM